MRKEVAFLDSLQGRGIRPGLARMKRLLARMGHPERACRSLIVAGTNGKGSTAATIASILQESGYRTGFYSSPHLVSLLERWRIDGENVSARRFEGAVRTLQQAVRESSVIPTYFEALTLVGFLVFRETACDAVVLEVGMGGRLDATNVVDPVVSAISSISLDHTEYLGPTVEAIAREKGGVIHSGAPAVTSNTARGVVRVLRERAREAGTRLHLAARECVASPVPSSRRGNTFRLDTPVARYELVSPLSGEHQIENVTLAVRGAELAGASFPRISRTSIERGVRRTMWRGRLEQFRLEGKRVIVDGAHNADGARRIAAFIERLARPRLLVFAVMADKDVRSVAAPIFPLFDRVVLTVADRKRGMDPRQLAEIAHDFELAHETRRSMPGAFRAALRSNAKSVVISGSLYLAGAAIAFLDDLKASAMAASNRSADETIAK